MADRHNRDLDRKPAPLPDPLKSKTVDSHAHLELIHNSEADSPLIKQVLADAAAVGIDRVVQVGYSAEQSIWSVKCAESFVGQVLAAVALHPNEAPVVDDLQKDLQVIRDLASHPRVRAIGESGLDFFRTPPELRDKQKYSFKEHIKIAKQHNKALVIHDRDSHREVLDTLQEEGAPLNSIFHCYSGDVAMAKECIANNYILSFAGTVTFKNAQQLRDALVLVPIEQLLVETDSPFLAPMPNRGALNTPAQIPNTLRVMADLRGVSADYLAGAISENAERIFGKF
ncbi:TatD DNase family protein [Candidatus Nanopelagicus hibericus]|uniref:TatD DNase family protein n=1 Tax=Candidatus Nanopelagicus hibericus TaxID=1884915 RepID=A0A249KAA9_9ACTN|nr:TatD family hydrolase [Candidatus Nanopelagicus hibericus]ASY13728.1 TatD DNase family protein [Candidatus Nanopelagicus hibericus]